MHNLDGTGQTIATENSPAIARKFGYQAWAAVIGGAAIASFVPALNLPLGPTTIIVLPITYAFVIAILLNILLRGHVGPGAADRMAQRFAGILSVAMLPFVVMLGAAVGQNWRAIIDVGPALALQEIGHFGGTVLLSFPIAVWILRLGRETVGATFSIAREPSVAIITERYGLRSPEGTGVLAVYIIGTLAGTLFFSILASLAAGTGLFDYRALAVACGIGSGSMTAACAGALSLADPSHKNEILALAGASNLISGIGGFYVTLFISLPLVDWLYRKFGTHHHAAAKPHDPAHTDGVAADGVERSDWLILAAASIAIPAIASKHAGLAIIVTAAALMISGASILISRRMSAKLPAVAWASLLGLALGALPATGALVRSAMDGFDPIHLVLLPLAIAGFALGSSEAAAARQVGWKLLVVSMAVFLGTFGGAVLIAQATLGLH